MLYFATRVTLPRGKTARVSVVPYDSPADRVEISAFRSRRRDKGIERRKEISAIMRFLACIYHIFPLVICDATRYPANGNGNEPRKMQRHSIFHFACLSTLTRAARKSAEKCQLNSRLFRGVKRKKKKKKIARYR